MQQYTCKDHNYTAAISETKYNMLQIKLQNLPETMLTVQTVSQSHQQIYHIVIPQRKIPARDWSKSCHVTFTNMHYSLNAQPTVNSYLNNASQAILS